MMMNDYTIKGTASTIL